MHNPILSRLFIILIAIHFIHCGCPGKPAPGPSIPPQNSNGSINSSSSILSPPSSTPPPAPVLTPITDDMIQTAKDAVAVSAPLYQILYDKLTSLKAGEDTSLEEKSEDGFTALYQAAFLGNISIIQALLDRNADVNAMDKFSMTPLHQALAASELDAALLLIKTGKITPVNLKSRAIIKKVMNTLYSSKQTALAYATDRLAENTTDPATKAKWQAIIDALRVAGAEK